jgi:hypothetical protein
MANSPFSHKSVVAYSHSSLSQAHNFSSHPIATVTNLVAIVSAGIIITDSDSLNEQPLSLTLLQVSETIANPSKFEAGLGVASVRVMEEGC